MCLEIHFKDKVLVGIDKDTNKAVYEGEESNATCLCSIELKDAMRLIAEALPPPGSDYALQVTYDFAGRLYVNGWVDETEGANDE